MATSTSLPTPLHWIRPCDIKVLYLAPYAPEKGGSKPSLHPTLGVAPVYNHEIFSILHDIGFEVEATRNLGRLLEKPRDFQYVFSLYNKAPFRDSEVFVSSICEYIRVPYLGARPHMRSLAEDKHLTKLLGITLGLSVPEWKVCRFGEASWDPPKFPGPYIVKPRCGAASMGIDEDSVQNNWEAISPIILKTVTESGDDAIVERFIEGANVTVAALGGEPPLILPPVQTSSGKVGGILTHGQKRQLDLTSTRSLYHDDKFGPEVQAITRRLYEEFHPTDYLRADYRVPVSSHQEEKPYLLEVNIGCNLGSHASMALAAKAIGLTQHDLVSRILDFSFRRQKVCG